ncbi:ribonuclease P protein component [Rivibacter subsaxonicus]|uniref:Ribonuclease P protein component n=1 Tax=Rivibacter subsaxonicus TaxID=457575 RepID=A0A4Q7VWD4_9BURK|nr:ribonuclease P protein component [Rivibacter subsaxonicus]RZU00913.1 ribonuclease P protein component [Rivibacter subsaxonicus]
MSALPARRWIALGDPSAFAAALSSRPVARTEHFVLHHAQLSTSTVSADAKPVEDTLQVGLVVPKRHARRAVTRNLIKRQARSAFDARAAALAAGNWVLRLRAPFDPKHFVSARSPALRASVRDEVGRLFAALPGGPRG